MLISAAIPPSETLNGGPGCVKGHGVRLSQQPLLVLSGSQLAGQREHPSRAADPEPERAAHTRRSLPARPSLPRRWLTCPALSLPALTHPAPCPPFALLPALPAPRACLGRRPSVQGSLLSPWSCRRGPGGRGAAPGRCAPGLPVSANPRHGGRGRSPGGALASPGTRRAAERGWRWGRSGLRPGIWSAGGEPGRVSQAGSPTPFPPPAAGPLRPAGVHGSARRGLGGVQ